MFKKLLFITILSLSFMALGVDAEAEQRRFASLKDSETNVRSGPGTRYPILWVYQRRGWPVEIVASYENWYKIRDAEGEEGWVYRGLVSGRRTVLVSSGEPLVLFRNADGSKPLLKFEPNVMLDLIDECGPYFCRVRYQDTKGWVMKNRLLMVE